MIQANELRIDNWVMDAMPFSDTKFQVRIGHLYRNDWEGIPLTPEILEKAGFTSAPVGDEIHWMKIFTPEVDLPGIDLPVFKIIEYKDGRIGYATRTIKYVHTFQNLYYYMTGEELNIEL